MNRQIILWAMAAALLVARPALAGLGNGVDSVQGDVQKLGVVKHAVTAGANYTVHDLQLSPKTTVREYVNTSGQVFAVSWDGPTRPDLRQLLGDYFDAYRQETADNTHRLGHHGAPVQAGGIVLRSTGHMRDFHGYAYVPALLPAGFSFDQTGP